MCLVLWGVQIALLSENLRKLEETQFEALLYSASSHEMSEWLDWYEKDKLLLHIDFERLSSLNRYQVASYP